MYANLFYPLSTLQMLFAMIHEMFPMIYVSHNNGLHIDVLSGADAGKCIVFERRSVPFAFELKQLLL